MGTLLVHGASRRGRLARAVRWLLVSVAVASCGTADTTATSSGPAVAAMRLTVGGQRLVVDGAGNVTGGPAVLRVGVSANVDAVFVGTDGVPTPGVGPASYRLSVEIIGGADVTYTQSADNALTGSIMALAPLSSFHARFSLRDTTADRTVWGPFEVAFAAGY